VKVLGTFGFHWRATLDTYWLSVAGRWDVFFYGFAWRQFGFGLIRRVKKLEGQP